MISIGAMAPSSPSRSREGDWDSVQLRHVTTVIFLLFVQISTPRNRHIGEDTALFLMYSYERATEALFVDIINKHSQLTSYIL